MKLPRVVQFADIASTLEQYPAIIDVRSEAEFAEDHVPGAINCPVLNNEERVRVGTLYKQVSPFEAKKIGAALVSRNIARHIERSFLSHPKHWQPLIYCWRGGNRSGAMALVLTQIGWKTDLVDGGYKSYRRHVIDTLETLPGQLAFHVVCGTTGSGKTRLLRELAAQGAQVLDLEALAEHRGSVLGAMPDTAQPSQKMFESRLWNALRRFDPARPVFVESESKRVGQLHIPDSLMERIRQAHCIQVQTPMPVRVAVLLDEYRHFVDHADQLESQLLRLAPLHGNKTIAHWVAMVREGNPGGFVEAMLTSHYDPTYTQSMIRNFARFDTATELQITGYSTEAFAEAARWLLANTGARASQ